MPEDTKKSSQKGKSDPKEQRRKRQGRHNAAPVEKKIEKVPEAPKEPEKPVYEPPGPEFYQSLKRETDEILKITEEERKYKKKEIKSNWAKYEMPIESYDEIDEQENLGADYEALIQASFSVGGHFQFKHEKSWDIATGPTPYDKYFDINMENLNVALSTIPFYERNDLDKDLFSESDIQIMEQKATKFKQKYYNDKKYTTPDLEAQEKILNILTKSDIHNKSSNSDEHDTKLDDVTLNQKEHTDNNHEHSETINIFCNKTVIDNKNNDAEVASVDKKVLHESDNVINNESKISIQEEKKTTVSIETKTDMGKLHKSINNEVDGSDFDGIQEDIVIEKEDITKGKPEIILNQEKILPKTIELPKAPKDYSIDIPKEPAKNPIIESPEDLEKWLDDFLDG
ncbi:uncharacterized protein LOC126769494 isoform X2 [Nymphalis io]|uniref:uncharacterized protein LOC126769494 isoform X2 n=1 Tax=Inachis io TaxID=171585 RepID=UPI002167674D|nr:uncharacterized protein LOC126769494 isoform X2 [Nymphalis io]